MSFIRHAAVAGIFYPGTARELNEVVLNLLAEAERRTDRGPVPKAIIAPHAGLAYSGPIAASAFIRLKPAFDRIKRVVLLGPSHRVPLSGIGISQATAFETPLGTIPLDQDALAKLCSTPGVEVCDDGHEEEHSLEVQLPFLQRLIDDFTIIPLVCNRASTETICNALTRVWGGPETVIIVSSDLSHFLDYNTARRRDNETCRAIESLDGDAISHEHACGSGAVAGLLAVAKRRGMRVETLDLRSSGDTAGDMRRVVGYGAWVFQDRDQINSPDQPDDDDNRAGESRAELEQLLTDHGDTLLAIAKDAIEHGLVHSTKPVTDASLFPSPLRRNGASFVTLYQGDALRGCVGTSNAHRPLTDDVAANAYAAAFSDSRFSRVDHREFPGLTFQVSLLTEPCPLAFEDERSLLSQLRPHIDGVVLDCDGKQALFLPQVWEKLPDAKEFIDQLKLKAGCNTDFWSLSVKAWRFETRSISSK